MSEQEVYRMEAGRKRGCSLKRRCRHQPRRTVSDTEERQFCRKQGEKQDDLNEFLSYLIGKDQADQEVIFW